MGEIERQWKKKENREMGEAEVARDFFLPPENRSFREIYKKATEIFQENKDFRWNLQKCHCFFRENEYLHLN